MKVPYAQVLEMDEEEPIELAKEHGIELTTMTFDDLQDAAGYVCTERDFESANGDDEDEEEEEEKKKENDEEDEDDDDDDDDDGAIQVGDVSLIERHLSRRPRCCRDRPSHRSRIQNTTEVTGGLRLCARHPLPDKSGDSRPGRHSH
jgi:hypothetical protein